MLERAHVLAANVATDLLHAVFSRAMRKKRAAKWSSVFVRMTAPVEGLLRGKLLPINPYLQDSVRWVAWNEGYTKGIEAYRALLLREFTDED